MSVSSTISLPGKGRTLAFDGDGSTELIIGDVRNGEDCRRLVRDIPGFTLRQGLEETVRWCQNQSPEDESV